MADLSRIPLRIVAPFVRTAMRTLFNSLGGIVAIDANNMPKTGPVLICPNHISDCDPFAVFVTCPRRDIHFVAKDEFFRSPAANRMLRACGAIPIRRDSADRSAIREIESILKSGGVVVLFPEGRLSETGALGRIQPGAAMIAIRSSAPIMPVGIARSNRMLPYGHVFPQRSPLPVRVRYGAAIEPMLGGGAPRGRKGIEDLTSLIESQIRRLTQQDTDMRDARASQCPTLELAAPEG